MNHKEKEQVLEEVQKGIKEVDEQLRKIESETHRAQWMVEEIKTHFKKCWEIINKTKNEEEPHELMIEEEENY